MSTSDWLIAAQSGIFLIQTFVLAWTAVLARRTTTDARERELEQAYTALEDRTINYLRVLHSSRYEDPPKRASNSEVLAAQRSARASFRVLVGTKRGPRRASLPTMENLLTTTPSDVHEPDNLGEEALRELFDAWADLTGSEAERQAAVEEAERALEG